jgi:hypothetical protein
MPTIQQIERLNKRQSEADLKSEQPLNKRKRHCQSTTTLYKVRTHLDDSSYVCYRQQPT